jgi:uncharacterized protein YgiM (DUF1202 family)
LHGAAEGGLGSSGRIGLVAFSMSDPLRPRRGRTPQLLALLSLAPWLLGAVAAQAQPAAPSRPGAPLREEPGDWWGDVHRWTGSDATRPTRGAAPAARAPGPPADGMRRVTTSATARANIRREPSTDAPILRAVRPGTVLTVIDEAPGGWLQVRQDGLPPGWVHQSVLQVP